MFQGDFPNPVLFLPFFRTVLCLGWVGYGCLWQRIQVRYSTWKMKNRGLF